MQEILEWRGVEGLVAAEVLTDNDTDGYTVGEVKSIAGVARIERTVNSETAPHYYDNIPAVIIVSQGADTITADVSAIPLDIAAWLTGQIYDADTGAVYEGKRQPKYFAVGYKTKKSNGDEVYVWRLKCSCTVPDQENNTENDSTDANGQQIVFTGISTTHKFEKTGEGAKAVVVDVAKNLADVSAFFDTVNTPDTLTAKTEYTLTISQAANTTVTVKRGSATLGNNAKIHAGDQLKISVTGGTVTVNSTAFISGDIHIVAGNTTVASTASA